jgi:predicted nucleic acid-binding protein
MNASSAYLDTSAIVKLIAEEPGSAALERFLAAWPERTSSALTRTEAVRALRRAGLTDRLAAVQALLRRVRLVAADVPILDRAAGLGPPELRSLDAIHLATALELTTDLGVFVTYDDRQAAAASTLGLNVASPGERLYWR